MPLPFTPRSPPTPRVFHGEEVPMPTLPPLVARVRPPEKVDVPAPFTLSRFAMLNDVDDAIGRIEDPVTFSPPARMVSPADTRRPFDDAGPAAERPPVNEDVAAPETVRMLVMAAEPSLAWPVTSRPPAKVEVPVPATFKRFDSESEVEEA